MVTVTIGLGICNGSVFFLALGSTAWIVVAEPGKVGILIGTGLVGSFGVGFRGAAANDDFFTLEDLLVVACFDVLLLLVKITGEDF